MCSWYSLLTSSKVQLLISFSRLMDVINHRCTLPKQLLAFSMRSSNIEGSNYNRVSHLIFLLGFFWKIFSIWNPSYLKIIGVKLFSSVFWQHLFISGIYKIGYFHLILLRRYCLKYKTANENSILLPPGWCCFKRM